MSGYTIEVSYFGYHTGRIVRCAAEKCDTEEKAVHLAIGLSRVDFTKTTLISPTGAVIAQYQNGYLIKEEQ